jgi:hypothetical protein
MATIREAVEADLGAASEFLAKHLGGRGGPALFRRIFSYRWLADKPNIGFLVEHEGRVRGFVGGIYSRRKTRGEVHSFCNVHSFAVDPEFRTQSLQMLKCLLDRPGVTHTCFSPSPVAVEILRFFKFQVIDATKVVFTPVAGLRSLVRSGVRLHHGLAVIDKLDSTERAIVRDHAGYRCGHFLLEARGERCYFVTVRRGRDVRAFADVLYASNPQLLADYIAHAHIPVGLTHRTPLIGLDRRLVNQPPAGSFLYSGIRPLAFRSSTLRLEDIDMLYSELVPLYA